MNRSIEMQFRQAGLDPESAGIRIFSDIDMALEFCEEEVLAEAASASQPPNLIWDLIRNVLPEGTPLSPLHGLSAAAELQPG